MSEPTPNIPQHWKQQDRKDMENPPLRGAIKKDREPVPEINFGDPNSDYYQHADTFSGPVNTGDKERDARIAQHRKEMGDLKLRIRSVKMMADSNPEKPAAIKAVQAEIARINTEAQMNPDWWTNEELALWRKQIEVLEE